MSPWLTPALQDTGSPLRVPPRTGQSTPHWVPGLGPCPPRWIPSVLPCLPHPPAPGPPHIPGRASAHGTTQCQRQPSQCMPWALKHNDVHSVVCQPHVPHRVDPGLCPFLWGQLGRPVRRGLSSVNRISSGLLSHSPFSVKVKN